MKKIAIIDPVGMKAGMDHYDLSLAKALIKNGIDTSVFSNFKSSENFVIQSFKFSFSKNIIRIFLLLNEFKQVFCKLKKGNYTTVIIHLFHSGLIDFWVLRKIKRNNFECCIILHDVENLIVRNQPTYLKDCIALADKVVVHNKNTFDAIERIGNVSVSKIHVISHGMYHPEKKISRENALKFFSLNPEYNYILFFGMIKKTKGLDVLLEAFKSVDLNTHLIIAGRIRDFDKKELEKLLQDPDLKNRFHFYPRYFSTEERDTLFSVADITILPYTQVYQSGVLILSISLEVPVIVSDIVAGDLVVHNKTGIIFESRNASDLSHKINELVSDHEKKKHLSENALKYLQLNNNWDDIGRTFYNILS
jgi:glycosyltransferase involved in cell wall biosynthesis